MPPCTTCILLVGILVRVLIRISLISATLYLFDALYLIVGLVSKYYLFEFIYLVCLASFSHFPNLIELRGLSIILLSALVGHSIKDYLVGFRVVPLLIRLLDHVHLLDLLSVSALIES